MNNKLLFEVEEVESSLNMIRMRNVAIASVQRTVVSIVNPQGGIILIYLLSKYLKNGIR